MQLIIMTGTISHMMSVKLKIWGLTFFLQLSAKGKLLQVFLWTWNFYALLGVCSGPQYQLNESKYIVSFYFKDQHDCLSENVLKTDWKRIKFSIAGSGSRKHTSMKENHREEAVKTSTKGGRGDARGLRHFVESGTKDGCHGSPGG